MFLQCFFNSSPSWCVSHESRQLNLTLSVFMTSLSLLWWLRQERICLQCGRPGFDTWVWFLGWEDSPGGGHGKPLQYSCLENPMDRGAWWATVHGATKSRTRLSDSAQHSTWLHSCLQWVWKWAEKSQHSWNRSPDKTGINVYKKTSLSLIYISIYSFSTLSH